MLVLTGFITLSTTTHCNNPGITAGTLPTDITTETLPLDIYALAYPPHITAESTPPMDADTSAQDNTGSNSILFTASVVFAVLVSVAITFFLLKHVEHYWATCQHPPAASSLYEDTGQAVYDAVVQDVAEEDGSHQNQYSLLQHGSHGVRGGAQPPTQHQQPDLDAYSTLSPPAAHPPQLYDQVYKNTSKKKSAVASKPHDPEADTPMDDLYAQVDKKKKSMKKDTGPTHMDQLYAQVDKKTSKKKDAVTTKLQDSGADTTMLQCYTQVEKKETKAEEENRSEMSEEEHAKQSGAVYSVINKPRPPQVPPKSDALLEELD